jgi:hypothetical protein
VGSARDGVARIARSNDIRKSGLDAMRAAAGIIAWVKTVNRKKDE